jgi:putative ABC transport system permease protein
VPAETFLRDIRIGLRILIKERSFCALAVIVLALGICGVTTMFSVVNGVMLRGFSFPTADRLASASFIDPSSASTVRSPRWTSTSSCRNSSRSR